MWIKKKFQMAKGLAERLPKIFKCSRQFRLKPKVSWQKLFPNGDK